MLETFCVIYIFAFSLPHMAIMGNAHSNFSLHKIYCIQKGVVSDPRNCTLENEIPQKGVGFGVGLCHEYERTAL